MGVALLLPDEWVILKLEYATEGRPGPPGLVVREELLRLATLPEPRSNAVSRRMGTVREIQRPGPVPIDSVRWEYRYRAFTALMTNYWTLWAGADSNRRSPRCKRDVITARPPALVREADSESSPCRWFR